MLIKILLYKHFSTNLFSLFCWIFKFWCRSLPSLMIFSFIMLKSDTLSVYFYVWYLSPQLLCLFWLVYLVAEIQDQFRLLLIPWKDFPSIHFVYSISSFISLSSNQWLDFALALATRSSALCSSFFSFSYFSFLFFQVVGKFLLNLVLLCSIDWGLLYI